MESPLWLDSLALADPYYILPVLTSAIMSGAQGRHSDWKHILNCKTPPLKLLKLLGDHQEQSFLYEKFGHSFHHLQQECHCSIDHVAELRLTNQEVFGSVDMEAPTTESTTDTPGGPGTMQKYAKWFSRGSALIFIPFTSGFPAGAATESKRNMLKRNRCQMTQLLLQLVTSSIALVVPGCSWLHLPASSCILTCVKKRASSCIFQVSSSSCAPTWSQQLCRTEFFATPRWSDGWRFPRGREPHLPPPGRWRLWRLRGVSAWP